MTVRRYPVAIVLVFVAAALIVVNGFAFWGDTFALWIDDAMQLSAGLAAVVCGVVVARRVREHQRWWRVLVALGMTGWSLGQCVWSWYQLIDRRGLPSPSLADLGYLSFPVFALAALFVLAQARSRPERERWQPAQWFGVAVVLDGLVVTGSLFILTWTAALGQVVRATGPDALTWAVAIAYPLSDLVVVVVAVLLVVFDRVDRPYRANLLLAAVGIVALACSDSVFAYLVSIGAESMKPWSDAGFVLGPLFIAFALLVTPNTRRREDAGQPVGVDWWQVALPYLPVTAVALLITVQVVAGAGPDAVEVYVGVLVVFLVLARQLLSLLDNRLLLRRVYEGQLQLTHQAYHDPLTGLANRALFADRLDRAVEQGGEDGHRPLVLIFVDLDDFKDVNDRFGHAGGDVLLHAVAQRLLSCVRAGDTVARLGGDEFAILLEGELDAPQAVADRIQSALRRPFAVHGTLVPVRASMGLVVPDPAEPLVTSDVLLGRADTSMYAGKRLGKDTTVVYHPSPDRAPDFPSALRHADGGLPEGFALVFQPIVRLADETPVAVEALARWTTRDGTAVSPETFVRAAEGAGLGAELDALVLDLACREITAAGLDLTVHVNVCASRLGAAELEESVTASLARYGLPAERLVVEITETVPVPDLAAGAAAIRRLQDLGVRVALDDFGAGYSSLTVLHALPVDLIKLDRALTTGVRPDRDAALCRSLVGLCADLEVDVVAEGIETAEQAELVTRAGCPTAQGYRFGHPAPLAALRLSTLSTG